MKTIIEEMLIILIMFYAMPYDDIMMDYIKEFVEKIKELKNKVTKYFVVRRRRKFLNKLDTSKMVELSPNDVFAELNTLINTYCNKYWFQKNTMIYVGNDDINETARKVASEILLSMSDVYRLRVSMVLTKGALNDYIVFKTLKTLMLLATNKNKKK